MVRDGKQAAGSVKDGGQAGGRLRFFNLGDSNPAPTRRRGCVIKALGHDLK